jgi:hypothetical protein
MANEMSAAALSASVLRLTLGLNAGDDGRDDAVEEKTLRVIGRAFDDVPSAVRMRASCIDETQRLAQTPVAKEIRVGDAQQLQLCWYSRRWELRHTGV